MKKRNRTKSRTTRRLKTNAKLRSDPTRSLVLRKRYMADMFKRFNNLAGLVRKSIVKNDALGLTNRLTLLSKRPTAFVAQPAQPKQFDFPLDSNKINGFMAWLNDAINSDILEVIEFEGGQVTQHGEWQNKYITAAYGKGITQADAFLRQVGIEVPETPLSLILSLPVHADQLRMLHTRNFEDLQGITTQMSRAIARELADGLSAGLNPLKIASNINDRIRAIGLARARTLARTEIVRAHAEATLNRYEQFGLDTVEGFVEFATAGDNKVCVKCEALEGKKFKIKDARGIIPVHPNCRCTWLPVIPRSN